MGHYLSEMPDIERDVSSPGVSQLWDWINTTVDVLRDHGGKMRQKDLERVASKVLGISVVRMPYVINNAIAERLIQRGGLGKYDHLSLV
jgi:hypothetical protein